MTKARLTAADWQTLNEALALLEACADDPNFWDAGEDEERFAARVGRVREKVHERRDGWEKQKSPASRS